MSKDDQVRQILATYKEDIDTETWLVQGQRVIYHKTLERIAIKAGIQWESPTFLISQSDHSVIVAAGTLVERREWSVGEAHIGVNYRVSGRQAAYPFAMAEKRAKDRVILKLLALHGLVYSEEEADDFKESAPPANDRQAVMGEAIRTNKPVSTGDGEVSPLAAMRRRIDEKMSVTALTELMLDPHTKVELAGWNDSDRERIREYARNRLAALGWKPSMGSRV